MVWIPSQDSFGATVTGVSGSMTPLSTQTYRCHSPGPMSAREPASASPMFQTTESVHPSLLMAISLPVPSAITTVSVCRYPRSTFSPTKATTSSASSNFWKSRTLSINFLPFNPRTAAVFTSGTAKYVCSAPVKTSGTSALLATSNSNLKESASNDTRTVTSNSASAQPGAALDSGVGPIRMVTEGTPSVVLASTTSQASLVRRNPWLGNGPD
mmetsp:Transcript_75585/g.173009  ORF Transcript_75585/g.173009 Transcript_75585/m.173009 type:complete len:213 (+) Transcript_75585:249-887(+)